MKKQIITDNRIVPLSQIRPNSWNPKLKWDETPEGLKNYRRLEKSIKQHGQVDPLLVREIASKRFEILNGFHRYSVMLEQGWTECEIKNLGKISDSKAKALSLATEDVKIPLDVIMRSKMVVELLGFDPEAEIDLPYDTEDIDSMKKLLAFDWDAIQDPEKQIKEKDYAIIIPKEKVEGWILLRENYGCTDDSELISMLIDEALG